ncbi:MAG: hypothetical protein R8K46_04785 [Mariprofundaceae bacterium]
MDPMDKPVSGSLKLDWRFLVKLGLSGVFTALGIYELGLKLELAAVALIFVPLAGLFFTFLKLEANKSVVRMIAIVLAAVAVWVMSGSVFLAIAFYMMLEGSTHQNCIIRT